MLRKIRWLVALGGLAVAGACGEATPISGSGDTSGRAAASGNDAGGGGSQAPATWPTYTGSCTGKPGALRGKSTQTLMAAGLQRSFIQYVPATLNADQPAPVVFIAHGFSMNADQMFDITRYSEIADREGFVALFPNGQAGSGLLAGPWNVGRGNCASSAGFLPLAQGDDQAFLNEMLRFVEADQCIDAQHVFMTGFSMGGYLSNESGCLRPELRAIAPHSGGSHDLTACSSERKPVLLMHFMGDGLIPYSCGQQARDRWLLRNGCEMDAPEVKPVQGGSCEYYRGCPGDGQVAMCSFSIPMQGMQSQQYAGHAWSGGSKLGAGAGFAIPETESASELSWSFFRQYAW